MEGWFLLICEPGGIVLTEDNYVKLHHLQYVNILINSDV